jgi:hypothetical protein
VSADLGGRQIDERRFTRDRHAFSEGAHLHRQVEGRRLADQENDSSPVEGLEPDQLRRDPVTPGHDLRDEVAASRTTHHLAEDTGLLVGDDDGHAGQHATLRIGDFSTDVRGALLSH